jgi:hypothetical protein
MSETPTDLPPLAPDEPMRTSKEQAAWLRCTVRTLDEGARTGDGPPLQRRARTSTATEAA